MNEHALTRTEYLIGAQGLACLKRAHVLVFGIGGVGSFAIEALARAGVGTLTIVDGDTVSLTNLNRQLIATHDSIGQYKADVMQARIASILPETKVICKNLYYMKENEDAFDFSVYDYVVDAVDMVTTKLMIIERCKQVGTPVLSSMGTGNKLDPSQFEIADISKTSVCPLAKVMRKELKARGIRNVKVVYSKELPQKPTSPLVGHKQVPGSISFVPPVAGMILASEVVRSLLAEEENCQQKHS